ncbi:MAG: prephenate dehydrogenase, partial [Candidatus Omnitrophica bacterium]|nr:prephenate dehydrogenase [Candidatus Omnitrophota bacterium]
MKLFDRVAIVGLGLIGGSMALEIKKRKLASKIIGVSRHQKTINIAKKRHAIDSGGTSLGLIREADLIILATPVIKLIQSLPQVFKLAKKGAVIIDVASTKAEVLLAANRLANKNKYFLGCHPLAGSEKRGIANAGLGLFKGSLCVLTPGRVANKNAMNKISRLWHKLGAKTIMLDPKKHDEILSFTSHLPHIMAFSLIYTVPSSYLKFA